MIGIGCDRLGNIIGCEGEIGGCLEEMEGNIIWNGNGR